MKQAAREAVAFAKEVGILVWLKIQLPWHMWQQYQALKKVDEYTGLATYWKSKNCVTTSLWMTGLAEAWMHKAEYREQLINASTTA